MPGLLPDLSGRSPRPLGGHEATSEGSYPSAEQESRRRRSKRISSKGAERRRGCSKEDLEATPGAAGAATEGHRGLEEEPTRGITGAAGSSVSWDSLCVPMLLKRNQILEREVRRLRKELGLPKHAGDTAGESLQKFRFKR